MLALLYYIVGIFAYSYWLFEGHPVSLARLARVHPGMTKEQVIAILGSPGTNNGSGDGSDIWCYHTRCQWCLVTVYFTPEGPVRETSHDH